MKQNYITVLTPLRIPVAAFTASPVTGYSPLKVVFTDKSTGLPTSWKWNFGDGTSSTARNPAHIYNKAGKYTITLTVKNAKGSNKIMKQNYITVLSPFRAPVASFIASTTTGNTPLIVNFSDTSTGKPTSWKWNFGDGSTSFEQNPSHLYKLTGNYIVTLTVANTKGKNSTFTTISVLQPATILPVANFSSNVTKGYAPLSVQFNDSSENSTEWNWDFGDGANSTEQNPVYIYNNNGTYNVTLTAKNANGNNKIEKSNYITVDSTKVVDVVCKMKIYKITAKFTSEYKGKTYYFCNAKCKAKFDANPEKYVTFPVANFSTNVSEGKAPLSVQFTDLSENATEISWDFDSNGVIDSTDRDPIYEYLTSGIYIVNLTAVNANGTDSKSVSINVSEKTATILPVANFSSNVTKGFSPLSVQFTDLSENATEWKWEFGDGANSPEQNPVHVYSNEGTYNVTLTAKNVNGNDIKTQILRQKVPQIFLYLTLIDS